MFENDDRRKTDDGVIGILLAHPLTFGSGELMCAVMTVTILTYTSNAKCFRNVTLINIRGLAVIIVPFRGHGRFSSNQVMTKMK